MSPMRFKIALTVIFQSLIYGFPGNTERVAHFPSGEGSLSTKPVASKPFVWQLFPFPLAEKAPSQPNQSLPNPLYGSCSHFPSFPLQEKNRQMVSNPPVYSMLERIDDTATVVQDGDGAVARLSIWTFSPPANHP